MGDERLEGFLHHAEAFSDTKATGIFNSALEVRLLVFRDQAL